MSNAAAAPRGPDIYPRNPVTCPQAPPRRGLRHHSRQSRSGRDLHALTAPGAASGAASGRMGLPSLLNNAHTGILSIMLIEGYD